MPLLPAGDIQLYDDFVPTLAAGAYEIALTQEIPGLDTGGYFPEARQRFQVRAPQFSLDPGDVGELFPPDGSSAPFGDVLQGEQSAVATVVLNARALPWERLMVAGDRGVPWLALVTLTAGEIVPDPATGALVRTSTVDELLAPDGVTLRPAIDPATVPPDVRAGTCQSVVVPAGVFNAAMPRLGELRYLAHVRETDTASQAASDAAEEGWYAVLLSNRFPDCTVADGAGTRNYVFLVSVEGFADRLDGTVGEPYEAVRMAVLASWSYAASPEAGGSFRELLEGFVAQEDGGADPAALLPAIPAPPSAPAALRQGYVPLAYGTATGERTFAWYRGPFTAVVPPPLPPPAAGAYVSSSELTIYVQEEGVFDLSYAAAWELGRAMALSDRAFATALVGARARLRTDLLTMAERLASGRFDHLPLERLAERGLTRRHVRSLMEGALPRQLGRAFASLHTGGAPPARPSRRAKPALRGLLARADVARYAGDFAAGEEMDGVVQWLAQLALFENVPFEHLIPDPRMLPVESIRFFYVDPGWTDALLDGALAIGIQDSADATLVGILRGPVHRRVRVEAGRVRARRRRLPRLGFVPGEAPRAWSGLLIRSALVAGWPGMVIRGDDGAVPVLRMEALSANVLLVLFDGVPRTVTISEPWHGLRFGVEDGGLVELRDGNGVRLGRTLDAAAHLRPGGGRVLDVGALAAALGDALGTPVTPALFATELFLVPEQVSFNPPL
ncbi:MAG TPA: hypothetical protein VEQ60_13075 [Longimicrobium sp.]|nr:hypothetical protein [Longimicrobium sp.]